MTLIQTFLLIVTIPTPNGHLPEHPMVFSQPGFASQHECLAVGNSILTNLDPTYVKIHNIKAVCHSQQIYISK